MATDYPLLVDAKGRNVEGRSLPIGVRVGGPMKDCALCGGAIADGTPVLNVPQQSGEYLPVCPSCIHQLNATLMREWEERHPEPALEELMPCPGCGHDHVMITYATGHEREIHLIEPPEGEEPGDYEEGEGGGPMPDADTTVLIACSDCGFAYWSREDYWSLLG